jgi:predicted metal-dependent HD superfamily phosphohydrolase
MDFRNISEQAEHYVRSYFDEHPNGTLLYHNLYHTERVVKAAKQIGQHYQLNDTDFFIIRVAAWFHDIGYLKGGAPGHEERGAQMAAAFLGGTGVEPFTIEGVRKCILATQLPQQAVSLTEQIVCDADLYHFGTDEFDERNKLMRKEVEAVSGKKISKEDWRRSTIRLVEGHQYYTEYCRLLLNEKQQENLDQLKHKEEEHMQHPVAERKVADSDAGTGDGVAGSSGAAGTSGPAGSRGAATTGSGGAGVTGSGSAGAGSASGGGKGHHADPLGKLVHKHLLEEDQTDNTAVAQPGKKDKKKDPGRGIDTVFRITSNNNQRLSSMADSKAHILIQVNSIIISVLLSLLLRKIEDHTNLAIPATLLLTVNLVTIIFSILATRPHIPPGKFSKEDLEEKKVNLLFFGNFYRMTLEEYAGGMLQLMEDRDFLYDSLIRDVYFQGIALGRKYKWLRLSYNVFMYGLIASVVAFMIAALCFPPK